MLYWLVWLYQCWFVGVLVLVFSFQGWFVDLVFVFNGWVLWWVSVWGKYLFYYYVGGFVVYVYFGFYGIFIEWVCFIDGWLFEFVGQVWMWMVGVEFGIDLCGLMVCELIDDGEVVDVVVRLGFDLLCSDVNLLLVWFWIIKFCRFIGVFLMD